MFHWAELIGVEKQIQALRILGSSTLEFLPKWIAMSLPFALWLLAYILTVEIIWGATNNKICLLWKFFGAAIAIGAELGQLLGGISGSYDPLDLAMLCLAATIGLFVTSSNATEA